MKVLLIQSARADRVTMVDEKIIETTRWLNEQGYQYNTAESGLPRDDFLMAHDVFIFFGAVPFRSVIPDVVSRFPSKRVCLMTGSPEDANPSGWPESVVHLQVTDNADRAPRHVSTVLNAAFNAQT